MPRSAAGLRTNSAWLSKCALMRFASSRSFSASTTLATSIARGRGSADQLLLRAASRVVSRCAKTPPMLRRPSAQSAHFRRVLPKSTSSFTESFRIALVRSHRHCPREFPHPPCAPAERLSDQHRRLRQCAHRGRRSRSPLVRTAHRSAHSPRRTRKMTRPRSIRAPRAPASRSCAAIRLRFGGLASRRRVRSVQGWSIAFAAPASR